LDPAVNRRVARLRSRLCSSRRELRRGLAEAKGQPFGAEAGRFESYLRSQSSSFLFNKLRWRSRATSEPPASDRMVVGACRRKPLTTQVLRTRIVRAGSGVAFFLPFVRHDDRLGVPAKSLGDDELASPAAKIPLPSSCLLGPTRSSPRGTIPEGSTIPLTVCQRSDSSVNNAQKTQRSEDNSQKTGFWRATGGNERPRVVPEDMAVPPGRL
jgi:hypothetical protein